MTTATKIDPQVSSRNQKESGHQGTTNSRATGAILGSGIAILRAHRLLCHLSEAEFWWLLSQAKWAAFKPGEIVAHQGKPVDTVHFIVAGRARAEVSALTNRATRAVINLLRPGDDMGLLSLVDGAPHSASVTALEDLHAVSIPLGAVQTCLQHHPEWYQDLTRTAVERVRMAGAWLQALI